MAEAAEPLSPPADPLIGVQCGSYQIEYLIGAGGMGRVYKARHELLGKVVALKVLSTRFASDLEYVQRFFREAKLAASLHHSNLVEVYDFGEFEYGHYLAMEFVDGMNLGRMISIQGKLDEKQLLSVARQALAALAHAHASGVIHRDIKPDNFLLQQDGILKLTDLGLAKGVSSDGDASLTMSGMVLGTPFYMPPEQVKGEKVIDGRADLYSLGATLFHCATGRVPFTGPTPAIIMSKHLTDPVPNPMHYVSGMSDSTTSFMMRLMQKNPDYRHANATEALQAIESIRTGEQSLAFKASKVVFYEEPGWREKLAPYAWGAAAILLMAGVGYWFFTRAPESKSSTSIRDEPEIFHMRKVTPKLTQMEPPKVSPTESISPKTSNLSLINFRVQRPQTAQDAVLKGVVGQPGQLTQMDSLLLTPEQQVFIRFNVQDIWDGMQIQLGQKPEIKRANFVVTIKVISANSSTKIKLVRLEKDITEAFAPGSVPIAVLDIKQGALPGSLTFNVTEEIQKIFNAGDHFGWVFMLEGEGEIAIASNRQKELRVLPALLFSLAGRPDLIPSPTK